MNGISALLHAGITALPVDLKAVAEFFSIKVVDYEACSRVYELDIDQIYRDISTQGFSMYEDGGFICVINGKACGKLRRRWTLAHEIGHILLGHVGESITSLSPEDERAADAFAAELLAPLPILQFCGVSSPEEIARLCGISRQAAGFRFEELSKLRRQNTSMRIAAMRGNAQYEGKNAFITDEDSRQLFIGMLPFISDYITERARHDRYAEYLASNGDITAE